MELETTDTTQTPLLTPTMITDKVERELDVIFRLLAERGRRVRSQGVSLLNQIEEDNEPPSDFLPAIVSS